MRSFIIRIQLQGRHSPIFRFSFRHWHPYLQFFFILFLFFDERLMIDLFTGFAKITIVISFLSIALYHTVGSLWLLDFVRSSARPQAFLSEPSSYAPIIPAMLLITWQRRQIVWMIATITCFVLAQSPTVIIVTILTGITLLVFFSRFDPIKLGLALVTAMVFFGTAFVLVDPDPSPLLHSGNGVLVMLGRAVAGVQFVFSGGTTGTNVRVADAADVLNMLRNNHLLLTGYGLNSSSAYFNALGILVKDASLPLYILFSYGVLGLVLLLVLAGWSFFWIRRIGSTYYVIYVPFLISSLLNSAEGFALYQFVFAGALVYLLFPPEDASL